MEDQIWVIISKHLDRAANAVGVLTILLTAGFFGILALVFGLKIAALNSLCFFGFSGALEVFHRQRKTDINNRNQSIDINYGFLEKLPVTDVACF